MNAEQVQKRIEITSSCRDSDAIPKVPDAGKIFFDETRQKPYQVMHNGLKVFNDSHYGQFNTQVIANLSGHHEPQEEKVFYEVVKTIPEKGAMIELGSYWAYYSMWFARQVSGARTYLLEPMKIGHGVENLELNGLPPGTLIEACVGKETIAETDFVHWDGSIHKMRQWAVDDLIREMRIDHVNILHADIQGAEFDMLKGARESLAGGKIDFAFISTHGMRVHEKCFELLRSHDYQVIAEHSPLQSFSVDGLIVMRHRNVDFSPVEVSKNNLRPLKQMSYRIKRALRQIRQPTRRRAA